MHNKTILIAATLFFTATVYTTAQTGETYIREFYTNKTLELLLLDLSMNYKIDFVFDREDLAGIEI